jgi:murein DD-endopeptidase MepM/ murein hydrolase activator NlpD
MATQSVSPRSARALAVVLAAALALSLSPGTGLGVEGEEELKEARKELRETRDRIDERQRRLDRVRRQLNRLATEIALNEAQINEATDKMAKLELRMIPLEERAVELEDALADRNHEAYITGPGAPLLFLLTATSALEAADRISMIAEMNRRDAVLAAEVQQNAERLSRGRAQMLRLQRARQLALQQLEIQNAELERRLRESRRLFATLRAQRSEIIQRITRIRPFAYCPVQGPIAISDSFGIWVHRSEERGGDHVHQGNDIMAPAGAPIVAPFDGRAVAVPNKLGGNAVNVYGEHGYVYNAHLSAYGTLGEVEAGDVIGYVGATGNTSANHDHFEWHPDDGPAADPYDFLLLVC